MSEQLSNWFVITAAVCVVAYVATYGMLTIGYGIYDGIAGWWRARRFARRMGRR